MKIFVILFLWMMTRWVSIESKDWTDSLVSWIVEESGFRRVTLATRLLENERITSPKMADLLIKITQKMPTIRLNITPGAETKNSSTRYNVTDYFIKMDVTRSLFVIVMESREKLPILPSERLMDYAAKLSVYQYRPTYLLFFIDLVPIESFKDTLDYAWSKKMYDFTILELPEPEVINKSLPIVEAITIRQLPIIHQLDRFRKEYRKYPWTTDDPLFPNKVKNMAGHPLRVAAVDAPPFSIARFDEFQKPKIIEGATVRVVETIASAMNAGIDYQPLEMKGSTRMNAARVLHTFLKSERIDLQSYLSPHYTSRIRDRILRTTPILTDAWCPVVPILPITKIPISINFLATYVVSLTIVFVFVIIRRVFRIDGSAMWRPFNVARILFAIPITSKPRRNVERVFFACLIILSMIYSNGMYQSITEISLRTDVEKEFRRFEDLDSAGLVPIITILTFNKTFDTDDPTLRSLRSKSIRASFKMHRCPIIAAEMGNVTCLMSKREATLASVTMEKRYGRRRIKIAEPCFWSDSRALLIGPGSPYRHRFDILIDRMQDTGLVKKLYRYKYNNFSYFDDNDHHEKPLPEHKRNMIFLRQRLVTILTIGCSLSALVLGTEILVSRFSISKLFVCRNYGIPAKFLTNFRGY